MSEDFKEGSLNINDSIYETQLTKKFLSRKNYKLPNSKQVKAFIPGTVMEIYASIGQSVKTGDKLLILEAMKMRNIIRSDTNGTIKTVLVRTGMKVTKGEMMVEFE